MTSSSQPRASAPSSRRTAFDATSPARRLSIPVSVLNDENLSGCRTRSSRILDPIQPARRAVDGERLSFFDDVTDEEMLGNDKKINDMKLLKS